jgi:hypothetical protein
MLPFNKREGDQGFCPRCNKLVIVRQDDFWGLWADDINKKRDGGKTDV